MSRNQSSESSELPVPDQRTLWHRLLATQLELLLTPFGISVQSEVQVMSEPPKVDVVLLRREGDRWNESQLPWLPDGIRQTNANHVAIECKIVESLDEDALQQGMGYDYHYRSSQRLPRHAVQTFLLSAITPQRRFFAESGYRKSEVTGVYVNDRLALRRLPLIVLNDLNDEPHNAFVQCFASRRTVRKRAYAHLQKVDWAQLSERLWEFMSAMQTATSKKGGEMIKATRGIALTPEYLMQLGKEMRLALLATMTPEERLAGLAPEERLAGLAPEERLAGLAPEERLAGLVPEEIESLLAQIEKYLHNQPTKPSAK